jgi:hypothetical protein
MSRALSFALIGIVAFSAALSATALVVSLLDDGGGPAAPASAGQVTWTIEDAKAFTDFPVYWLGESYEGLPLTRIVRGKGELELHPQVAGIVGQDVLKEDSLGFIYGSCDPGADGGCVPPLVVSIEPYCVNPSLDVKKAYTPGAPFEVRGAWAREEAGHLVLRTNVIITIFTARDDLAVASQAAEMLRKVGDSGAESARALPPAPDPEPC